jgi:hypothetical protein
MDDRPGLSRMAARGGKQRPERTYAEHWSSGKAVVWSFTFRYGDPRVCAPDFPAVLCAESELGSGS